MRGVKVDSWYRSGCGCGGGYRDVVVVVDTFGSVGVGWCCRRCNPFNVIWTKLPVSAGGPGQIFGVVQTQG